MFRQPVQRPWRWLGMLTNQPQQIKTSSGACLASFSSISGLASELRTNPIFFIPGGIDVVQNRGFARESILEYAPLLCIPRDGEIRALERIEYAKGVALAKHNRTTSIPPGNEKSIGPELGCQAEMLEKLAKQAEEDFICCG